jgi:hypothetical protein
LPSETGGLRQTFLHYFVFFAFGLSGAAALIYEVVLSALATIPLIQAATPIFLKVYFLCSESNRSS